ncbi:MAG: PIN domain-containing protein [Candidatus Eremiobacteraeota bacterium]|nr:PIN domain-containing protein [Candidatus Eremiobacteraeota bacterium]
MKERIIDTNIILRYLTDDIEEQAKKCENLFRRVSEGKETIELPLLVIAEVVWTMTRYYKQPRKEVVENLSIMLTTPCIKVRDKKLVLDALELYIDKNVSFTDAYLATACIYAQKGIYSFDEDFDNIGIDRSEPF